MRHICISDVHGDFDSMMKAINEVSYDPESGKDLIILAGDGFGRADFSSDLGGSRRVYEYMISPIHKNKPIYIFGNHEDILRNILRKRMISYLDSQNGELNTILSLSNMANIGYLDPEMTEAIDKVRDLGILEWINSLPPYYETKTHIITHGWLTNDILSSSPYDNFVDASWAHTINSIRKYVLSGAKFHKTIVFGHWDTNSIRDKWSDGKESNNNFYLYENSEYGLIGLDACTILSHRVNTYIFEE